MHVEGRASEELRERGDELKRIGRVLDAAAAGEGSLVVVAAPAGMGKTKLLEAAVADSSDVGARALVARGSELERDFAFGVVRQLLEDPVLAVTSAERDELLSGAARHAAAVLDLDPDAAVDRDLHATLHGLYWLLVNLSGASPLLIAVDDLQWVDEPSLRWLAYVTRRLERLPVAVVATARTTPGGGVEIPDAASDPTRDAIGEVVAAEPALRLEPEPLSPGAVADVLLDALGQAPDEAFTAACHRQTGGNPFLLSELVAELVARELEPTAASVSELEDLVPERIGDTIRRHLSRLSSDARDLAASVAVLGEGGELPVAAELAGIDPQRAAAAAAELVGAQMLADSGELRFRHPLQRTAVEAEIPALEVARRHGEAARLIAGRGAATGRVAAHLAVSTPGEGDEWVVTQLRTAARSARTQGTPGQAVALLTRALAEPPPAALRAAVLRELGEAELSSLHDSAAEHLRAARELTEDSRERADLAISIGLGEYYASRHAAGVDGILAAIEEVRGDESLREEWLRLEALLALVGRYDLETEVRTRGRVHDLAATLPGSSPAERLVRSMALTEKPGPTAADLIRSVEQAAEVADEVPWPDPGEGMATIAMYLHAGRPDAAMEAVTEVADRARAKGSPLGHGAATIGRAMVALDCGDLRGAVADFDTAYAHWRDLGEMGMRRTSLGPYIQALSATGDFERAEALLAEYDVEGNLPERMFFNMLLHGRGWLRLDQRRYDEAEADFRELGRRHALWGMTRPSPAWRSCTALALIGLGRADEARVLAAEELEIARIWDTPKALSIATRVLALTETGEGSITGLETAVELIEDGPWRLDRARARLDLGSALRRTGRRRDGRAFLELAMDEAHACGAEPLAERAADELRASGARPRRRALSGRDALTPSELRVSEMAAEGRSNREIAQELFVTMATVETHLTRSYRKLDVSGRDELPEALA